MSMILTDDDLHAIKVIFDEGWEDSKRHTAAGFAEVHEKIDNIIGELDTVTIELGSVKSEVSSVKSDLNSVKETVERIERVQRAEIQRVDHQESAINKMRKTLRAV